MSPENKVYVKENSSNTTEKNQLLFLRCTIPIRYISSILGLNHGVTKNSRLKFSNWMALYGFVTLTLVGIVVIPLPFIIDDAHSIVNVLFFISTFFLPTMQFLSIFKVYCQMKSIMEIFNESQMMAHNVEPSQLKKGFWLQFGIILIFFLATITYDLSAYIPVPELLEGVDGLVEIMTECLIVMTIVLKIQFISFVAYLTNVMSSIGDKIAAIDISTEESNEKTAEDFMKIEELYEKVQDLAGKVNDHYGFVMGVSTLKFTYSFITFCYYVMTYGLDTGYSPVYYQSTMAALEWVTVWSTEQYVAHEERISQIVYQVIKFHNKPPNYLYEQLRNFLTYVSKRRTYFSICGLVPLDYSLLFTIAGIVGTYLIILVQFHDTPSQDREETTTSTSTSSSLFPSTSTF